MLRKFLAFLKETPGNVLWDISKWVFAGAVSLGAIIVASINNLPWVFAIPVILGCGIVFSLVGWAAIRSLRQFVPEAETPLDKALDELKDLRGEVVHIFQLTQLSLLAKPLDALERLTWVLQRSRILIKHDAFRDYVSASDLNRYDTHYNEDDLINIEKQYEKRGYLGHADKASRALFRYLYERWKRLDEVIAKIDRSGIPVAAPNDRTSILVAVAELKGLRDEGDVMLGTFRVEELYGARPTLMDVEAYVKRLQASVRRNALGVSPGESALFEQPWPSGELSHIERQRFVRGLFWRRV